MIVNSHWFTSSHCVGVVQIVQEHEKEEYRQTGTANFKYYIGVGWGQDKKLMLVILLNTAHLFLKMQAMPCLTYEMASYNLLANSFALCYNVCYNNILSTTRNCQV